MSATRSRKQGRPARTARNDDWTDREILGIIDEIARTDADGSASTTEIGMKMGFSTNGNAHRTPATAVGGRLAWMRDGGILESSKPDLERSTTEPGARDTRWRLTDEGRMVLLGKVSKTVQSALERMDPGARVVVMRELMRSGWQNGSKATAFVLDRQFRHDKAQHKVVFRERQN